MKKIKKNLVQGLMILVIILSIFFGDKIPYFRETLISIWILVTFYFEFIERPKPTEKRIYLTTQNDSSIKHKNLIIGITMIIGVSLFFYFTDKYPLFLWLLLVQSFLFIFIDVYKKSEAKGLLISVHEQKQLFYSIGKVSKTMTLEEIRAISIKESEIIISRDQKKKNYLSFLKLSTEEIKNVSHFLRSSLPSAEITTEN